MRFFLHKPSNNNFAADCVSKVPDVFLKYNISQFIASGGGFTGASLIKADIVKYNSVGLSVQWGAIFGNYLLKYPYIDLVEKHHEGGILAKVVNWVKSFFVPVAPPVHNKFPVPYNPDYIEEVKNFIEYLSIQLKPYLNKIAFIHTNGIEQTTFENRVPNQNFSTTSDKNLAYEIAAKQWKELGYTNDKILNAFFSIYGYWNLYFPDTVKVSALISGTNGYPKIDDYGNFNLNPPRLTDSLLNHLSYFKNVAVMATALSDKGGVPANFTNSGLDVWYQLDNATMNKSMSKEKFEAAILRAKNNKGELVEVYEINVREHYSIIEKYRD